MAIASKEQAGHLDRMLTMEMARVVEAAAVAEGEVAAAAATEGTEAEEEQVPEEPEPPVDNTM